MVIHELKILPKYFNEVLAKKKTFEIRKDDRNFKEHQIIDLHEFDGKKYTGNKTRVIISYVLRDAEEYGLKDGFVILGIKTAS